MRLVLLAVVLALAADAQPVPDWQPIAPDGEITPALWGVWQSRGYGWVFEVDAGGAVGYDVSAAGCLRGVRQSSTLLTSWLRMVAVEGEAVRVSFREANSTQYVLDPLPAVPAACATPPGDSPREVFDYAWGVMDAHYAFFDLYGVDWDARYAALAPTVHDDMTEAELFETLSALLDGLADGHLELTAAIDGEQRRHVGKGAPILGPALRAAFEAQGEAETQAQFSTQWFFENRRRLQEELLSDVVTASGGNVFWGRRGRVGYLFVTGMDGFADDDGASFAEQVDAVHDVMDRALTDLADTEALLVDVALNQGGFEEVGLAIAGHFANWPTRATTKYAHTAEAATRQSFTVEPAAVRYLKPVTVLTSDVTLSAAETFTLAMRALPTVTHVGATTRGALSDILSRRLPNGWMLELSNEVYLDTEGEVWEGRGIAPEVPVRVFSADDVWGHVSAVRGVMDWLDRTVSG